MTPLRPGINAALCIFCAADGEILRIQHNELFKNDGGLLSLHFQDLFDESNRATANSFVEEILKKKSAFNWPISIAENSHSIPMLFTGGLATNEIVIFGAIDQSSPEIHFYEELMKINNEQNRLFRSALSSSYINEPESSERQILDNLQRMNNDLLELQRALAKKNLELNRTPTPYRFFNHQYYDFAYSLHVHSNQEIVLEWITDAFEAFCGYPIESQTFIALIKEITHPDDRQRLIERFYALLNGTDSVIEFRIRNAAGEIRWLRDGAHALVDGKTQKVYRIVGASEDITALKQAEEDIQKAQQALVQASSPSKKSEIDLLAEFSQRIQKCESAADAYQTIEKYGELIFTECSGELVLDIGKPPVCAWENPYDPSENRILKLQNTIEVINHSLGVLNLFTDGKKFLNPERTQKQASIFAEQIGISLSNLSLRDQLEQQATQDALTGLYNRRYLNSVINYWLERAEVNQSPVSIIMIDLDHFKNVNDSCGHAIGDDVLVALSRLIKSSIRSSDLACRLGGEEFLLVLPDATPAVAFRRIEKIREEFANLNHQLKAILPTLLTFSAGIATYPQDGSTLNELLNNADRALYCAKQDGRNQTKIYSETQTDPFPCSESVG